PARRPARPAGVRRPARRRGRPLRPVDRRSRPRPDRDRALAGEPARGGGRLCRRPRLGDELGRRGDADPGGAGRGLAMVAVLVPVGPGSAELARFRDLLDSLHAYEPAGSFRLIVVDDGPAPRDLGVDATVIRTPLWRGGRRP